MKERPILFNSEMVRAILDGKKTQTRRIVKWPLISASDGSKSRIWGQQDIEEIKEILATPKGVRLHPFKQRLCPFGKPGQRLRVRDTFNIFHVFIDPETGYGDDIMVPKKIPKDSQDGYYTVAYRADGDVWQTEEDRGFKWRPSIHMPRWASRLLLGITNVRIERLQDISEEDAIAEGCPLKDPSPFVQGYGASSASGWYSDLWEQINGDGSWGTNPYVWVVEFEKITNPPKIILYYEKEPA
jgi:hypothetical protein